MSLLRSDVTGSLKVAVGEAESPLNNFYVFGLHCLFRIKLGHAFHGLRHSDWMIYRVTPQLSLYKVQ